MAEPEEVCADCGGPGPFPLKLSATAEKALMKQSFPGVLIWLWADAPEFLRDLSRHGGDEEFLIYFPPGFDPTRLAGVFHARWEADLDRELMGLPDGSSIAIFAHA